MLSQEKNELITRVGPGTGAGMVMRNYWLPAALTEELNSNRPVVPVHLLGEPLVLFRTGAGEIGLMARHCPHRGVDLCYGRLEMDGLRCPFHGWKFASDGQCLEQPAEPAGSTLHKKVKARSYPVIERNGIIFAYMGEGAPPPLPDFDCLRAPENFVFSFKGLWECNWLQALEVGIDPAHASFLHRFLEDDDPADQYGKQFRDTSTNSDLTITAVLRDYDRPDIQVEETDYGLRIKTLRYLNEQETHVRVTNQLFPCAITIPMSTDMNITQWHVPIDDENCYWYAMFTSYQDPVDKEKMRAQRLEEHDLPLYSPRKNKRNNYGYDPEEQRRLTYTGMGMDINVHDQWACESMGAIQDRTAEYLATTDRAITSFRRMMFQAIKAAEAGSSFDVGRIVTTEPIAVDGVGPAGQEQTIWREQDQARRRACSWDAALR